MNDGKSILVVGSIALDSLETPIGSRTSMLGGSASFFSIAASLLAPIKMVGVVGLDYPEKGRQLFISRGINIENVQTASGKTFRWGCKYNKDYSSRETIFTDLGVFESFSPEIKITDRNSPLVFLGNIQPNLQLEVAQMMNSPEYLVCDTMNLWIDLFPEQLSDVIKLSNVLLINHEEAEQFSGLSDIVAASQMFLEMGPGVVVIKMGADGLCVSQKNKNTFVPVYPVDKLIDPTGAGDSFAGGFMGYLSQSTHIDFIEAAVYGSAMASFCVEGFGVEALLSATPSMLKNRIKTIKDSMSERVFT